MKYPIHVGTSSVRLVLHVVYHISIIVVIFFTVHVISYIQSADVQWQCAI